MARLLAIRWEINIQNFGPESADQTELSIWGRI